MTSEARYEQPEPRQVVLVAVLGALLGLLVAWRTGVPLQPSSLDVGWFTVAAVATAAIAVILHGTRQGNAVRWFLANTNWGQFIMLVAALLLLAYFSRLDDVAYTAELASVILGASVGSLARLAVV